MEKERYFPVDQARGYDLKSEQEIAADNDMWLQLSIANSDWSLVIADHLGLLVDQNRCRSCEYVINVLYKINQL